MTIPGIEMQNFIINEHDVCTNPEKPFVFKSKKIDVELCIAKKDTWAFGYHIQGFLGNCWGSGSLPGFGKRDRQYATRDEAVVSGCNEIIDRIKPYADLYPKVIPAIKEFLFNRDTLFNQE